MLTPRKFLSPGQRYAQPSCTPWRLDRQVTVVRVDRDAGGAPRVVSRFADGEEFVAPALEVELAIAAGLLVPVAGAGRIARC